MPILLDFKKKQNCKKKKKKIVHFITYRFQTLKKRKKLDNIVHFIRFQKKLDNIIHFILHIKLDFKQENISILFYKEKSINFLFRFCVTLISIFSENKNFLF